MISKRIFSEMSLELKGDYTFHKGTFLGERKYGFLKFALYKTNDYFIEVQMDIKTFKIEQINIIENEIVKKLYTHIYIE